MSTFQPIYDQAVATALHSRVSDLSAPVGMGPEFSNTEARSSHRRGVEMTGFSMASLEMLYHEASHTTVTAPLEEAISSRLKATGRDPDSDLWHGVQFYTVGAVTREVLARHGESGYQPYADKRGLYTGYWSPFMPVIDTVWLDHMAGKTSLQQAARQMVDRLPLR